MFADLTVECFVALHVPTREESQEMQEVNLSGLLPIVRFVVRKRLLVVINQTIARKGLVEEPVTLQQECPFWTSTLRKSEGAREVMTIQAGITLLTITSYRAGGEVSRFTTRKDIDTCPRRRLGTGASTEYNPLRKES
jgi:hypothetical protein